jgi:uncharacterized repeat protein (TIGR01451 family)
MTEPISRRSAVKAGAHAAWMVPAVAVATAVPAYAVSGGPVLALTGVSSTYGSDGPDAERPDRLETTFTLTNTGGAPASNVVVSLFVPAGLYASPPSISLPPGEFVASAPEGSMAAGWWLRAVRALPLGVGQTATLGSSGQPFGVAFQDPLLDSPYRRWAGRGFTATLQATATSASTVAVTPGVSGSAKTYFEAWSFGGSRSGDQLVLHGLVTNVGRKTCTGPMTIEIGWDGGSPDGSRWTSLPGAASSPQLGSGTLGGDGSFGNPWFYSFTYNPARATRQSLADFYDPAADPHCDIPFDVTITLGEPPGYTPRSDSRDVRLVVTAPDVRDYPFILAYESISGSG